MVVCNIEETSNSKSKDIMSQNRLLSTKSHYIKRITPTKVKQTMKENKLLHTYAQNVGLIKELEHILQLIQLDKYPQGQWLFLFFDYQHKEMEYVRIALAEEKIPLSTSFILYLEIQSIMRQEKSLSILNDSSHMSSSFTPIQDENKFDMDKFVWD